MRGASRQPTSLSQPSPSTCSKMRFVSVCATAGWPVRCVEHELAELLGVASKPRAADSPRLRPCGRPRDHAGQVRHLRAERVDLRAVVLHESNGDERLHGGTPRATLEIDSRRGSRARFFFECPAAGADATRPWTRRPRPSAASAASGCPGVAGKRARSRARSVRSSTGSLRHGAGLRRAVDEASAEASEIRGAASQ